MESAKANYKQIKSVKDSCFELDQLHQYVLAIQLGIRDFQLAVINHEDRLILLEDYVIGELNSTEEWLLSLKSLFDSHTLLQAGFWKEVKISLKNKKFVQVPQSLFDARAVADYLQFNAHLAEDEEALFYEDSEAEIVTVFPVPGTMYEWFNSLYARTKVSYYHQSAAIIRGLLNMREEPRESLYILVDRFKLHIISIKSNRLIFYNQFVIRRFPDYVKYIMLVMKGLSMNQETCRISLWGFIGNDTPHYQEFCRYVRNVGFGARPENLKFGYFFDEVQTHHFVDLYSLFLLK